MKDEEKSIRLRLHVMENIARSGGELALGFFRSKSLERKVKGVQDFVSEADWAVEQHIREEIRFLFPGDSLLGEEEGSWQGESRYTWIIDPIDGTTVFLSGLPGWVVTIALLRDETIVAGVVYDPCHREMFSACKHDVAKLNGLPLPELVKQNIATGVVGIGFPPSGDSDLFGTIVSNLLKCGGSFYRNRSAASMLAQVAAGRLLGFYEPHLNAWDCLAGLLLIEEVGGRTLPVDIGKMLICGGPVLGAAPGVFEKLQEIISNSISLD